MNRLVTTVTAMRLLVAVMVFHWAEHLIQAVQVYALGVPRHHALGLLGMVWPSLVHNESMHFTYSFVMLLLLVATLPKMHHVGRWWLAAVLLQTWHTIEHTILIWQAMHGQPPVSIIQHFFPRIELHLFYNTIVTIPVLVAMWLAHVEEQAFQKAQTWRDRGGRLRIVPDNPVITRRRTFEVENAPQ